MTRFATSTQLRALAITTNTSTTGESNQTIHGGVHSWVDKKMAVEGTLSLVKSSVDEKKKLRENVRTCWKDCIIWNSPVMNTMVFITSEL